MDWLEKLRDAAQRPPDQPRMPLLWNGQVIGTVAEGFLERVGVDFLRGQRITLTQKNTRAGQCLEPDSPRCQLWSECAGTAAA